MAENLNINCFRNGDLILDGANESDWVKASKNKIPALCECDPVFDKCCPKIGKKYGKLYNGYAVNDSRKLAPSGWRVPTLADFDKLAAAVNFDRNALKAIGQGKGEGAGTNTSGFSALLAGQRGYYGEF